MRGWVLELLEEGGDNASETGGGGGGPETVKGGEAPKPCRPTAMTVLGAASRSTSGSQMRELLPVPWTSSRCSHVPRTSWCRSCSTGGCPLSDLGDEELAAALRKGPLREF